MVSLQRPQNFDEFIDKFSVFLFKLIKPIINLQSLGELAEIFDLRLNFLIESPLYTRCGVSFANYFFKNRSSLNEYQFSKFSDEALLNLVSALKGLKNIKNISVDFQY